MLQKLLILFFIVTTVGCGGSGSNSTHDATRSYFLGFTPFPYAVSQEAIDFSYAEITANADFVAHHLEEGIPWDELDADLGIDSFPSELKDGWAQRKAKSPPGHLTFVAVTPISLLRNGIAPRPSSIGGGLPDWLTGFNLQRTKDAYLNYTVEAVDFFNPDYLVIGIEVNELMHNQPDLWADYLELHQATYNSLKTRYPGLSISVSFTGMHLIEGYTDATSTPEKFNEQLTALSEAIGHSDLYCLSLHTFISALLADTVIGQTELDRIFSLSNKPKAICETSYPAQVFSIGALTWNGDVTKQNLYFDNLFAVADDHAAQFIVNFVIRDYDDLWVDLGSPDDINKMWRDTGFYDEAGLARRVLATWQEKLALTRQ